MVFLCFQQNLVVCKAGRANNSNYGETSIHEGQIKSSLKLEAQAKPKRPEP